jgi:glycosyltransferase involved in cell wall biosynthesis
MEAPVPVVAMLCRTLGYGGAESTLVRLVGALQEYELVVHVLHEGPAREAVRGQLQSAGATLHEMPVLTSNPVGWLRSFSGLLRQIRPDVLHAFAPLPSVASRVSLGLVPRRWRPALVYREANVWPAYRWATRIANGATFALNDHSFAVSDAVRDSMSPRAAMRTRVLVHGLDATKLRSEQLDRAAARLRLGIPHDRLAICSIGNLKPAKNYGLALDISARLRDENVPFSWHIIGRGDLGLWQDRVKQRDLQDFVFFHGAMPQASVLLPAFDLYVSTSIFEGLSVAVMEAMATGLPTILSDSPGSRHLAGPESAAIVIPDGDANTFARIVKSVLSDASVRTAIGALARARAEHFDIHAAAAVMHAAYLQCIRESSHGMRNE